MFTESDRSRLRDVLVARARADERVVAAALVGSLAAGTADRWSDVDLSLGVRDDVDPADVLRDWSAWLAAEERATVLLDWPVERTVYRVFVRPDCLQVDLSVTPATAFTRRSPRFRLLFGEHTVTDPVPPSREETFAFGVLYAVETRRDIERGRVWQAQHFLEQVRDHALTLACLNRGLPERHGKGYDGLPAPLLESFAATLTGSVEPVALRSALRAAVDLLLAEADGVPLAERLREPLREVAAGAFG